MTDDALNGYEGVRKPLVLICLLLLAVVEVPGAQAIPRQDTARNAQRNESGNWSARASSGLTLMGTWTGVPDPTRGTVIGTWTLVDTQGKSVASGAWSAAKSPTEWIGAWRAVVAGRTGEYTGTWTASVDHKVDTTFVHLFERAVQAVVSGTWRVGGQSGAWAIRAAKKVGGP